MGSSADSAQKKKRQNPHKWNSLENYQQIHQARIDNHSFVDHNRPDNIAFEVFDFEGDILVRMSGEIYCLHNIVVGIEKYMETRRTSNGKLQVRSFSFRYNAKVRGKGNVLRYDNGHRDTPHEFHRHVFDVNDGKQLRRDILTLEEMPTLAEMLDELQMLFKGE